MCASRSSVLFAIVLATLALPVGAADKDAGKEQARRQQQMQRKFEQEKAQLTQEKGVLEAELSDLRKKSGEDARRTDTLAKESAALRSTRDALKARLAEREAELAEMRKALADAQSEGKRLQAALGAEKQQVVACTARNDLLHQTGLEVLDRYVRKGCMEATLQAEPFTGLMRVEIENTAEDLRERLDAQRLALPHAGATPGKP